MTQVKTTINTHFVSLPEIDSAVATSTDLLRKFTASASLTIEAGRTFLGGTTGEDICDPFV